LIKDILKIDGFYIPKIASKEQIGLVYDEDYVKNIRKFDNFPLFSYIIYKTLDYYYTETYYYHVGSSILGGELALIEGWSICLSGQVLPFDDTLIAAKSLLHQEKVNQVAIVGCTKRKININLKDRFNAGNIYLLTYEDIKDTKEFKPDIIFYVSEINLDSEDSCIMSRDQKMFEFAFTNFIPIVMNFSQNGKGEKKLILKRLKSIMNIIKQFDLNKQKILL
jgi:hypothetical protein